MESFLRPSRRRTSIKSTKNSKSFSFMGILSSASSSVALLCDASSPQITAHECLTVLGDSILKDLAAVSRQNKKHAQMTW
eukprot:1813729-Amphidinium_carterae.1